MRSFQSFRLDTAKHCLWRGQKRVPIPPKAYDVLRYLVENPGRLVITGQRDADLAAAIKQIGRNVTGVQGDVSNLRDFDRLFAQIKREKGKLDIVFASDGMRSSPPLAR
jgi:NAD(P)-dependent dehydrogenase (short-subunit alcohol dehydrogenase family)